MLLGCCVLWLGYFFHELEVQVRELGDFSLGGEHPDDVKKTPHMSSQTSTHSTARQRLHLRKCVPR